MLFLLFEAAEFMCVHIVRQKLANLRIILYKECNKSDVTEQSASWDTCDLTSINVVKYGADIVVKYGADIVVNNIIE